MNYYRLLFVTVSKHISPLCKQTKAKVTAKIITKKPTTFYRISGNEKHEVTHCN